MIALAPDQFREVAVLGAHCGDIAVGIGGTLLTATTSRATRPLRVHVLVLAGEDSRREIEERHAVTALCPGAKIEFTVLDVPENRARGYWEAIRTAAESFRRTCEPDVVFAPHTGIADPDRGLLAEMVPSIFREHLVLGYELAHRPNSTAGPAIFHPLTQRVAEEKARIIVKHYPSQSERNGFDEQAFLSLARLRGVQCCRPYAEAFVVETAVVRFMTD